MILILLLIIICALIGAPLGMLLLIGLGVRR